MSMYGNLKKNLWWRMTSFRLHLIPCFLTYFLILRFMICLVKIHHWIFLLLIIHITHRMSIFHLIAERTHLSQFVIFSFWKPKGWTFLFLANPSVWFLKSYWCRWTYRIFWSCRDLFTPSFDHDIDSLDVDLSKPPVFDVVPDDEVGTPQVVEALQPKLMVMSGAQRLEVSSTLNQNFIEPP